MAGSRSIDNLNEETSCFAQFTSIIGPNKALFRKKGDKTLWYYLNDASEAVEINSAEFSTGSNLITNYQ